MTDAELLLLADREADRLNDENDQCGAVIMRALVNRLRAIRTEPAPFPKAFSVIAHGRRQTADPA